jgi:Tannase and feruloyl esterase
MNRVLRTLLVLVVSGAVLAPAQSAHAAQSCESLVSLQLKDMTVDSAVAHPGDATLPPSCRVEISSTHPPQGDDVNIWVWLPAAGWNNRFQATGGGGFSGGSQSSLPGPLRDGYVTAATDTGHVGSRGSFALNPDGSLNWQSIQNNAYLGVHEMTVAAKAVARSFYGRSPKYSYFNGCSTGGRQGLLEAQRYPDDYDGILAASPAINAAKLRVAQLWGPLAMLESNNFVEQCKFQAATAAAVAACDDMDGVEDGVIGDPTRCPFDPASLVGTSTACGEITAADAEVMRKIWDGARATDGRFLWYGLARGASFAGLSNTRTVDGVTVGAPSSITLDWTRYFLLQDPDWDWHTLTHERFEQLFTQSVEQYGVVTGPDDPNLSRFRASGGKIIAWHGWADQLVYPLGTIDYFQRVNAALGGASKTGKFARLFMAPGVAHCGGGNGPEPVDAFGALVRWVEQGKPPHTLAAAREEEGVTITRPLCPYPLVARYDGRGSTEDAANFACARRY